MNNREFSPFHIEKEVKRILKNKQPFTKKEMINILEQNFNKVCINTWIEDSTILDILFKKERYLYLSLWVDDKLVSLQFISYNKGKTWYVYEKNKCKNKEFIFS